MQVILIVASLLCISLPGFSGEEQERVVKIKTKKKKTSILRPSKPVLLGNIKFDTRMLTKEQVIERATRTTGSGGDDVGNGGDETRRVIIDIGEGIIDDLVSALGQSIKIEEKEINIKELKEAFSTQNLIIVDGLKVNNGVEEHSVIGIVSNNLLIMDFKLTTELRANRIDLRNFLLHLALTRIGIDDSGYATSAYLYSFLKGYKRTPWCPSFISNHKILKTVKSETFSGKESQAALSSKALKVCATTGLNECRISETGFKGFAGFAKNFATYKGFFYKIKINSSNDKRSLRCKNLKSCETYYHLSPLPGPSQKAFTELESQIEESCI